MPKPRKVEKKVKPKESLLKVLDVEDHIIVESDGTVETPIVVAMEDTYSGIKKEDSGVILKESVSKREQIDALLANPCTFYPDPTRLQYGTEMWPWLKQLSELLE